MKVNSLKISNILTFPHCANIDNCQEIKFDDNLNIIIGPNGSGKSNFVEIINQLFKRILVANYTLDESTIEKSQQNPDSYRIETTIAPKIIVHTLQKNLHSETEKKEIKLEIGLSDGDW